MPAEPGHGDPGHSGTGRIEDRPDGGGPAVRVDVHLRWGDMDAYGHVNNVQVAAILEEIAAHAEAHPDWLRLSAQG